jgi:hypothetical protein
MGLRFPDVREDQRAGLSRSDEGRVIHAADGEDVCKTPAG